jgi:membrane protein YdbS with pleckstrin-like domain
MKKQKQKNSKFKLKAGIICISMFLLLIVTMLLTSMNGIIISLAIVFHLTGLFLLVTSGYARGNYRWNNWAYRYSRDPMDPTNPFYRSRHRLD